MGNGYLCCARAVGSAMARAVAEREEKRTYLTDAGSSQASLPPLLLVLVTALGSSAMQLRRLERVVSREAKDGAVYSGRLMASIAVETASPAESCSECVLLAK